LFPSQNSCVIYFLPENPYRTLSEQAGQSPTQPNKVQPSQTLLDLAGHCLTEGFCLTF
jgi:hypothetical protein